VQKQSQVLQELERECPGISEVERDENGTILLTEDGLNKTVEESIQKYGEE